MMKFSVANSDLLQCMQSVIGVVERRLTLAILSNVLFSIQGNELKITATDLEIEIESFARLMAEYEEIHFTLAGRKLLDILRNLPEDSILDFFIENQRVKINVGRGKYTLATLPAEEFPNINVNQAMIEFSISQNTLRGMLEKTQFAIANQDVRYYLNGMLWEVSTGKLTMVAMDGHRLSYAYEELALDVTEPTKIIVPQKGITELLRLLKKEEEPVVVKFCANYLAVDVAHCHFRCKLIDENFPDYRVLLNFQLKKHFLVDKKPLRQVLTCISALTSEQFNSVRIEIKPQRLHLQVVNQEQDEGKEEIPIVYQGEPVTLGFNIDYLLDVLAVIQAEQIKFTFHDSENTVLIQAEGEENSQYVIMPLRL